MQVGACSVADCDKPAQALGLCAGHYTQLQVRGCTGGVLRTPDSARGCQVAWCRGGHKAGGLCSSHYAAALRLALSREQAASAYSARSCPICRNDVDSSTGRHRHGDHDHDTGAFRAVICQPCNLGLGLLKHDSRRLRSAADYLSR